MAQEAWCLVALDQPEQGIATYHEALMAKTGEWRQPTPPEIQMLLEDAGARWSPQPAP